MFSCGAAACPLDALEVSTLAKGSEPLIPVFVEVRMWASQFAAESRVPGWIARSYVWPEELSRIWDHLEDMRGGTIGIIGLQGVGKSSALQAIYGSRVEQEERERDRLLSTCTVLFSSSGGGNPGCSGVS